MGEARGVGVEGRPTGAQPAPAWHGPPMQAPTSNAGASRRLAGVDAAAAGAISRAQQPLEQADFICWRQVLGLPGRLGGLRGAVAVGRGGRGGQRAARRETVGGRRCETSSPAPAASSSPQPPAALASAARRPSQRAPPSPARQRSRRAAAAAPGAAPQRQQQPGTPAGPAAAGRASQLLLGGWVCGGLVSREVERRRAWGGACSTAGSQRAV